MLWLAVVSDPEEYVTVYVPGEPVMPNPANVATPLLVDAVSGQTIAGDPNDGAPPSGAVPLHELVDSIERRTQGRAAQLERKVSLKGRPYYELELQLPDGRGLEIHVDPVSGQILREEDLE